MKTNTEAPRLLDAARAIEQRADDAGRLMTNDEEAEHQAYVDRAQQLRAASTGGGGRRTTADPTGDDAGLVSPMAWNATPERRGGTGMVFQDAATGEQHRAFAPGDQLSAPSDSVSVGRCILAAVTGRLEDLAPPERAALSGGLDTAGGFMVNPAMGRQVIDLARAASVCMRAGASTIDMTTSELNLTRITADPTGYWRPETAAITASEPTFGRITLRPKTLAAIVPISLELLEDAADAPGVIEQTLQRSFAAELDRVALIGTGAESEPKGIRNHADVNAVATVGTPADYADVTSAVQQILAANYNGDVGKLAWVTHPRDGATYDGLVDTTGQPLRPTPWAAQVQRYSTTSLPITEGAGSNESVSIVGDFEQLVYGMRTSGVRIRVLESGSATDSNSTTWNAASQLLALVVAYVRVDVALLRPTWFSLLSGITTA